MNSFEDENGVALILSVLIITILGVVILNFSRSSQVTLSVAENRLNSLKAYYLAKSGIKMASLVLNEDDISCDSLNDEWSEGLPSLPLGDGMVALEIIDEAGKLNINDIKGGRGNVKDKVRMRLSRLIDALGMDAELVDEIVKGAPFDSIGEVPAEDREKVSQFMTVRTKGGININTAPEAILISLSEDMTESIARSIIDYRKENPFRSVPQIKEVAGIDQKLYEEIKGLISVKSNTYHVTSRGSCQNARMAIEAFLKRRGSKGCDVIYWRLIR